MLVELLGHIGGLAELARDAQRLHPVRDAGLRQRVRDLRAHAADDLVILDGDHAAARRP